MASVFEKNGFYYLRYKDERGRWRGLKSEARTKTEARRLADDKERLCERVRFGVEQACDPESEPSIRDLLEWWMEKVCKGKPSYKKACSAIRRHLCDAPFASKRPRNLSSGEVEEYFDEKTRIVGPKGKALGPQAVNHLRGFLRRTFKAAIKQKRIAGLNPIDDVKVWKVPKRKPDFLRSHEVAPVLANVPSRWRSLFATAIYTGLRKGELLGLRKADLDFQIGMIFVRRSYDRDTTKGGHEEGIPMARELVPYLEDAVSRSPSELVFPRADGTMFPETTKLEDVLRRSVRRAGIILGYRHKCRKSGCGYVEATTDDTIRRCPTHGHLMWVTSVVRPIRFHDLRHTTGSLLTMQGANLSAVQRIMRHKDPRITSETYLHLDPSYLRREIDRLSFGPPAEMADTTPAESAAPLVSIVCLDSGRGRGEGDHLALESMAAGGLTMERDIGLEPTTFSLGS
jgi:integrase